MCIFNRLLKVREALSKTQKEISSLAGITVRAYINYEKGERDVPISVLNAYSSLDVNANWLLTGKGSMFLPQSIDDDNGEIVNVDSLVNRGLAQMQCGLYEAAGAVYVPMTSITACCGNGTMTYPDDYETVEAVAVNKRYVGGLLAGQLPFAVQTEGRSMEGYGIREGSIVIVNPAEQTPTGTVVLVIIDQRAAIKKLYARADGIDLTASTGDKIHVTNEEMQDENYIHICGKVMLVIAPPEHGV